MFQRCIASVKLRWMIAGFLVTFLVVCYQLSATSIDQQQLLTNKEYIQNQVHLEYLILHFPIYYEY